MSGKKASVFPLRMADWVKEEIKVRAEREGLSVNAAIIQRLVQSLERESLREEPHK
ncbi:TPA: Arc family DNA-binding protein [Providencia alcalifaciens]|uniref:Arc family DNA-binding protein n=1 Tax=Providencia alcalifaciens TaxID=126385 RepID=UPI001CC7A6C5|nr:Arc family DNA-binding protein [Providencia alcalifaciens]